MMQQQEEMSEDKVVKAIVNLAFCHFMMDMNLDEEKAKEEWQSLEDEELDKYMEAAFIDFATMDNEERKKWIQPTG